MLLLQTFFWKVFNKPAFNVASSLVIIYEIRFKICVKSYVFHFKPCTWLNFQSCLIAQITIENWSLHRLCLWWSLFGYLELWPQWHYLNNSTIFIRKWNLEINYCRCFPPSRNYHGQCRKHCNNCVCLYLVKTSLNVCLKNPFLSPNIVIKYQHHSYSYSNEPACSSIRGVIGGGPKECIYLGWIVRKSVFEALTSQKG